MINPDLNPRFNMNIHEIQNHLYRKRLNSAPTYFHACNL